MGKKPPSKGLPAHVLFLAMIGTMDKNKVSKNRVKVYDHTFTIKGRKGSKEMSERMKEAFDRALKAQIQQYLKSTKKSSTHKSNPKTA